MGKTETARTVIGIIGNVISFGLFASPIPTFKKIIQDKTVAQFKPDPYLATVMNCALWSLYGIPFVHPDSTLVVTINSTGLAMELIYTTIFLIYSDWQKRKKIFIILLIIVILMTGISVITFAVFHTHEKRTLFVGVLCVVFNIVMYAAPLTVMRRVIKTKSVKYMPFALSCANLANGVIWLIYAFLKIDPFIVIPNALGTISGIVQIALFAIYYKSTPWDEPDEKKQNEVQLTGV